MQNKKLKILAIDDNQDNLITLKAVVSDVLPGTEVLTALTGWKGIELALAENPDVILLDIIMPEMDGFEVCRRLKHDERLQHIPVLFLTALKTNREIRMKALETGAEAFLSKPFDETELIAQILSMAKIKAANVQQHQEKERLVVLVAERTHEIEQELFTRRKVEQELLLANLNLNKSQTAMMKVLEDLKAENEERKKAEAEIIKAKEEAEAANAAQSQFLANMSHKIRTPLNGVMGMLQLLQITELTKEQKEYVSVSKTSSDALLVVLNDILDYSKIEAGKMELEKTAFNLGTVINDAVSLFKLSAQKKGLIIEVSIERDVPDNLIGDPFRLRQILSNLMGNAVKFTNEGQIDISIRKIEERSNRKIKLEFVVKDTGIGIPPDKTDVLFKSFSQVDNSNTRKYGGTGLGLTISKSLVELMAGEIWVESREGEGSSFYFICILEMAGVEKGPTEPSEEKQVEYQKENELRLLLAEDDAVSRMVVEQFARRKGWKVTLAENGKEAVDMFQRMSFDAILMDVQIPVIDGYSATGIIRQKETLINRRTPIIGMTAYALKGDKGKCLEAGMDDYISKPVNIDEFYATVELWTRNNKKAGEGYIII